MKKVLYICATPYQLLNVLRLRLSCGDEGGCDGHAHSDLCVEMFPQSNIYCEVLKKSGLFKEFFAFKNKSLSLKKNIKWMILGMSDFLFPKHLLRETLVSSKSSIPTDYDGIYTAYPSRISSAIIKLNPKAKLIFYDDGIGSYGKKNIALIGKNFIQCFFLKVIKSGPYVRKISKLYVSSKEISMRMGNVSAEDVEQIPSVTEKMLPFLNHVFQVDASLFKGKKIILLSQTDNQRNVTFESARDKILKVMKHYIHNILVRLHPRDMDDGYYSSLGFNVDAGKDLWELKILNQDMNNVILISAFSTASMTPKILFNMEPFLIFTYPLYHQYEPWKKRFETIAKLIQDIKNSYSDPSKVVIVNNVEELQLAIDHFLKLGAESHE